ncbi:MAG: thiamine pyrophosphate-binding protein [Bdellovibrionales bacterium]|nr:thiamine pyrophosphate-binding protein [Bdellovibrionales bacterium]
MKLADYVVKFLEQRKINDIFLVSGGGIMHLIDAVGKNENINYYCNYHEQACAIAAEGHARVTGKPAVCLVTVGPGAVNALAGIVGAWYDSIPMIVVTGQVKKELIANFSEIRQRGPQEGNVLEMARPVTKYAVSVVEPNDIRKELEKAFYIATSGRPGPVWVEIPLDIQGAEVNEETLPSWDQESRKSEAVNYQEFEEIVRLIENAERPLLVPGNGVWMAGVRDQFVKLVEKTNIPVAVSFTSKDLLPEEHDCFVGVFGTAGQRRANFAVQNCDLLISLGSGLSLSKVGFNYGGFAPKAKKIIIDIDKGQVFNQVVRPDVGVVADLKSIVPFLTENLNAEKLNILPKWREVCSLWKRKYFPVGPEFYDNAEFVNSYVFMDKISDLLVNNACLTVGNGLDCVSYYQAFKVKEGQRTLISGNWGSMGWDLPLAIGACIGRGKEKTLCVTGDGSLQWNVQELMTISKNRLPIKIFVFNNRGYSAIRATQKNFSGGKYVASDEGSGVGNPNFELLAQAYGIRYFSIQTNADIVRVASEAIEGSAACLVEVNIHPDQWISPKASAYRDENGKIHSRPLEDMEPLLPREEIEENMSIFD